MYWYIEINEGEYIEQIRGLAPVLPGIGEFLEPRDWTGTVNTIIVDKDRRYHGDMYLSREYTQRSFISQSYPREKALILPFENIRTDMNGQFSANQP